MNWEDGLVYAVGDVSEQLKGDIVPEKFYESTRRLATMMHEGLDAKGYETVEAEAKDVAIDALTTEERDSNFELYFKNTFDLEGALYRTVTTDLRRPSSKWTQACRVMTGFDYLEEGRPVDGSAAVLGYDQSDIFHEEADDSSRITRVAKRGNRALIHDIEAHIEDEEKEEKFDAGLGVHFIKEFAHASVRESSLTNVPGYGINFMERELPVDVKGETGEMSKEKMMPILGKRGLTPEMIGMLIPISVAARNEARECLINLGSAFK